MGKGAFGSVYLVEQISSGKQYVMKETFQNPKFANREAEVCSLIDSEHIVKFHAIWLESRINGDVYLHLLMDAYPMNLQSFLDQTSRAKQNIPEFRIRKYLQQILKGLKHIHHKGLAHRDLKPDNILVRPETNKVVICDLGSAKFVRDGSYNKSYICSRLYRAPELICGCQDYSTKIDIWSVGCIMGEMYLLRPLFPGKDNDQQLEYIQRLLGNLSSTEKQKLKSGSRGYFVKVKFPNYETALCAHAQTKFSRSGIMLLKSMLTYDAKIRASTDVCLRSNYFYDQ